MTEVYGGRYQVIEELGRGGVGQVLLARDDQLDRPVAVKTLLEARNSRDQARFVEEARITGKLAHPNIVTVHGLDAQQEVLFLVMKRVEGEDLKVLVRKTAESSELARQYPLRRRLRIFLKVCDALAYAHSRGVIHRDLKPANVMLSRGDEPLVLDWGLAKPVDAAPPTRALPAVEAPEPEVIRSRLRESFATRANLLAEGDPLEVSGDITMEGAIVGTPAYMPPEQADSQAQVDQRADVYALGAMLYELLTGAPPYEGTTYQCLKGLLLGPPPAPTRRAPEAEIPAPLEAITLKAMARQAADRYPDASALKADVAAWLDGDRVEAYPEGPLQALERVVRRHKVAFSAAGVAFLVVNALLVLATVLVLGEEERVVAATRERESQAEAARQQAQAVETATRLANLTARSEQQASAALRALTRFKQLADSSVPIEKGDLREGSALHRYTIGDLHLETRVALGRCKKEIEALIAEARGEDTAPLQVFAREVDAISRQLDRTLITVLMARSPSQALLHMRSKSLDLGEDARLLEARALLRQDKRTEALAALPAGAGTSDATTPRALALRALHALLSGRKLSDQQTAFDAAIEADPLQGWLWLRRAEVLAARGEFDAAERNYQQATKLQKVDAWIYSSRMLHTYAPYATVGLCRTMVGFIHQMAPENHQADVVPDLAGLWRFGNLKGYLKRVEGRRAAGHVSERTALRQKAAGALLMRDWPELKEITAALLRLDASDRVGLACSARLAIAAKTPDVGLARLKAALINHPEDAGLRIAAGLALLRMNEPREALEHLQIGARSSLVSDPWRWLAEAVVATRSEDPDLLERGVRAARRGLALDPLASYSYHPKARPVLADPRLHRVLGQLRRRQGRLAEATLHHLRAYLFSGHGRQVKALGLDFQDAFAAAEIHEELGLPAEAHELYRWAAQDPKLREKAEAARRRIAGQ